MACAGGTSPACEGVSGEATSPSPEAQRGGGRVVCGTLFKVQRDGERRRNFINKRDTRNRGTQGQGPTQETPVGHKTRRARFFLLLLRVSMRVVPGGFGADAAHQDSARSGRMTVSPRFNRSLSVEPASASGGTSKRIATAGLGPTNASTKFARGGSAVPSPHNAA